MKISLRALALAIMATVLGVGTLASPAMAANPVYQAYDADNDPYNGIYLRNSTSMADATRVSSRYMTYGTRVELLCGTNGESVGPKNNSRWHSVKVLAGTAAGQTGWIADRYLNTPNKANQPTPGEKECGSNVQTAAANNSAPKSVDVVTLGTPQNGKHRWGNCDVQDFKQSSHDWVIVSYTGGTYVVRQGMLFGWFDNGGAPGSLGCPKSNEYVMLNSNGLQMVRQDFTGGSLFWNTGMNHAVRVDSAREGAINWAVDCVKRAGGNTCKYDGRVSNYALRCLGFVNDAYRKGQGMTPTGGPDNSNARTWQNRMTRSGNTNADRGAYVFWNTGKDGHVALSVGGGLAITTQFHGSGPRLIRIADYPGNYAGWAMPGLVASA